MNVRWILAAPFQRGTTTSSVVALTIILPPFQLSFFLQVFSVGREDIIRSSAREALKRDAPALHLDTSRYALLIENIIVLRSDLLVFFVPLRRLVVSLVERALREV